VAKRLILAQPKFSWVSVDQHGSLRGLVGGARPTDLRTLGVLVGAILSTVGRAFFVRCRSTSGTSQSHYDFEPPEFFHGSSYLGKSLLRCSIQIGESLQVACVFRFRMVRCRQSGVHYLSSTYLREGRFTESTTVLGPILSGTPRVRQSRRTNLRGWRSLAGFFLNTGAIYRRLHFRQPHFRQPHDRHRERSRSRLRRRPQTERGTDWFLCPAKDLEMTGLRSAAESWPILRPDLLGTPLF
jgi:hypothetical protein